MREKIGSKITRHCVRMMPRLFYKFPILSNPRMYNEMQLVDNEDVETMITVHYSTGNIEAVELYIELKDVNKGNGATNLPTALRVVVKIPHHLINNMEFMTRL